MTARRAGLGALVWAAAAIGAGCSSSPFDNTLLSVQVDNAGSLSPDGGHTVGVTLANMGGSGCPLAADAVLTVGERSWPFGSCVAGGVPAPVDSDLDLKVWNGPNSSDQGQAVVGALVPGADAAVVSPLSDTTTPGGDIQVSVPPVLQTLQPLSAAFVYLGMDDPAYAGENTFPTTQNGGSSLVVAAPKHAGRFRFSVSMTGSDPSQGPPAGVVVSCFGFSKCVAIGTPDLGPLQITVVAPAP